MSSVTIKCGKYNCGSPGYSFCFAPPKVSPGEEECWDCVHKGHLCNTTEQQYGCELYCQDLLDTSTSTLSPSADQGVPELYMNIIIPVAVVVTLILVLAVTLIVYKRRCRQKRRGEDDVVDSIYASPAERSASTLSADIESQDGMIDRPDRDSGTEEEAELLQTESHPPQEEITVTLADESDTSEFVNKDKFNQVPPSSPHSDIPKVATTVSRER